VIPSLGGFNRLEFQICKEKSLFAVEQALLWGELAREVAGRKSCKGVDAESEREADKTREARLDEHEPQ
jgi:hypothetical protein